MISAANVEPSFAAAERYKGDWVVPFGLGRAHLIVNRATDAVVTACGRTLIGPLPAARLWDGCLKCVEHAELR